MAKPLADVINCATQQLNTSLSWRTNDHWWGFASFTFSYFVFCTSTTYQLFLIINVYACTVNYWYVDFVLSQNGHRSTNVPYSLTV